MRKFYQIEWQGIPFESFFSVSSTILADAQFYAAFYEEFFKRHATWDDVDPCWIATKDRAVQLIASRIHDQDCCLSIGCGLGYIEKQLFETHKFDLQVTETSAASLKWLSPLLPPDRLHIGFFPACIPAENSYDLIYLSGVDYCFDHESWQNFLIAVRSKLKTNGRCLVISGSLQQESAKATLRTLVVDCMVNLGMRKRGQLWGYLRTMADYRTTMSTAGFSKQQEGILADGTYWIEGQLKAGTAP